MPLSKRILVFSLEFPPYLGGAATYAGNLSQGLSELGHDVSVLTVDRPGMRPMQQQVDEELNSRYGIRIERAPFVPKLYLAIMARWLRRLTEIENFELLIVADSGAQKSSAMFNINLALKTWSVLHGSEVECYFRSPSLLFRLFGGPSFLRRFFRKIDGCIAVSEFLRQDLVQELPELDGKCAVVHHGVECEEEFLSVSRENAKADLGVPPDSALLFSASRLVDQKGQDVLIRATGIALEHEPALRLLIAGDGPARRSLERLARAIGIAENVEFLGHLTSDRMDTCFRACDLFVLPTRIEHESFGLVFVEANARGRIVIAGDVGGVSESVEDGVSGHLVDPNDVEGLSRTILTSLRDREATREMERRAFERTLEKFRLVHMARNTLNAVFPGEG